MRATLSIHPRNIYFPNHDTPTVKLEDGTNLPSGTTWTSLTVTLGQDEVSINAFGPERQAELVAALERAMTAYKEQQVAAAFRDEMLRDNFPPPQDTSVNLGVGGDVAAHLYDSGESDDAQAVK